jgi:hypothetical protein
MVNRLVASRRSLVTSRQRKGSDPRHDAYAWPFLCDPLCPLWLMLLLNKCKGPESVRAS